MDAIISIIIFIIPAAIIGVNKILRPGKLITMAASNRNYKLQNNHHNLLNFLSLGSIIKKNCLERQIKSFHFKYFIMLPFCHPSDFSFLHQPSQNQQLQHLLKELCLYVTFHIVPTRFCWLGSSVGMATDYGLDGPGSNPGGDEIFRPSRPALCPTQPLVPGLSRG